MVGLSSIQESNIIEHSRIILESNMVVCWIILDWNMETAKHHAGTSY